MHADAKDYGSTSKRCRNEASASSSRGGRTGGRRRHSDSSTSNSVLYRSCVQCQSPCCKKRYLIAVMCCIGFVITFGFRCSTIVATNHFRNLHNATLNAARRTGSKNSTDEWTVGVIGAVEGAYFIGHLASQIPGGILANKISPTRVFSVAIFVSSVLHLFLPVAFNFSYILALSIRLLQGLFEGGCIPACHGIWRYWAPPLDRSRLVTLSYSGPYAGSFLGLLLSGVLAEWLSWPAPFYFYGGAGVLWFSIWQSTVYQKPSQHPCISDEEQEHIESSIGESMDVNESICDLPWKSIFTSMPVHAIIVANFSRNWALYLLISQSTKFFHDVYNYSSSKSGFVTSFPHLIMAIVLTLGGQLADEMRKRWLSTTVVRKLFNSVGFGIEAAFFLGVGYSTNDTVAIVCLTVAVSFSGLAISGFSSNPLDIAPRYASIIIGLSNGVGGLAGILIPIVAGFVAKDRTHASWSRVFLITAVLHLAGVIFYVIFASGEKQDWAKAPPEATDEDDDFGEDKN